MPPSQPLASQTKSLCVPGEEGWGPIWPQKEKGAPEVGEQRESPQAAPPPSLETSEAKTSTAKRLSQGLCPALLGRSYDI